MHDEEKKNPVFEHTCGLVSLGTIFGDAAEKAERELKKRGKGLRILEVDEVMPWIEGKRFAVCIQCGLCCFQYEVSGVPGYSGVKPICQDCRHHKPPSLQNGKWTTSECRIHDKRPNVCADYSGRIPPLVYEKAGKDGKIQEVPCAQGVMYWRRLIKMYGGYLPATIRRFFMTGFL